MNEFVKFTQSVNFQESQETSTPEQMAQSFEPRVLKLKASWKYQHFHKSRLGYFQQISPKAFLEIPELWWN